MSEIRICKYCGMELLEDVPHGLRECHLRAVARIAELEAESERFAVHSDVERQDDKSPNDTQTQTFVYGKEREE
jgi:hypothetical protein